MSDSVSSQPRRRLVRKRLIFTALALLAIGAAVYFGAIRDRGPRPLKLALVTWTEDPFWEPLLRGARDHAKGSGVELVVIRSKPTAEAQTRHVRELLDSGIDGIAISPNDAEAQRAILDEAVGKVPVVTFDTDAPASKPRRFVGIDNYAAGRFCADELREAMPDGGPVLISVGSVTMQHGRDRRQGVIDELLERGFDRSRAPDPLDAPLKGPRFTVVATATDGGDPAKSVEAVEAALRAHPEVKGVIGLFSYSAPAALDAAKRAGHAGGLKVVGFDESAETQAALEAGTIHSSIVQDSYRCGSETIRVLADEARGVARGAAERAPVVNVGINVMRKENVADLRAQGLIRPLAANPGTPPANP